MAKRVDDQITDSITQVNTKVLGDAPTVAMGKLYQATAKALAKVEQAETKSPGAKSPRKASRPPRQPISKG